MKTIRIRPGGGVAAFARSRVMRRVGGTRNNRGVIVLLACAVLWAAVSAGSGLFALGAVHTV